MSKEAKLLILMMVIAVIIGCGIVLFSSDYTIEDNLYTNRCYYQEYK